MINLHSASIGIGILAVSLLSLFIPADSLDDSPNEEKPNNEYFSKKDVKVIAVALAVFVVAAVPTYIIMKGQLNAYLCRLNLQAISVSMSNYMVDNDDRLPPMYVVNPDNGLPALDSKGLPSVWASTLINISGFDPKRSFLCPSAQVGNTVQVEGLNGKAMPLSYGLYAAVAEHSKSDFANASSVVMVAETDNGGADHTFDPCPIRPGGANGPIMDGFMIGYSTGNDVPSSGSLPMMGQGLIKHAGITRLAFADTSSGLTDKSTSPRHEGRILALFLDGHYGFLNARQAEDESNWALPVNGP